MTRTDGRKELENFTYNLDARAKKNKRLIEETYGRNEKREDVEECKRKIWWRTGILSARFQIKRKSSYSGRLNAKVGGVPIHGIV